MGYQGASGMCGGACFSQEGWRQGLQQPGRGLPPIPRDYHPDTPIVARCAAIFRAAVGPQRAPTCATFPDLSRPRSSHSVISEHAGSFTDTAPAQPPWEWIPPRRPQQQLCDTGGRKRGGRTARTTLHGDLQQTHLDSWLSAVLQTLAWSAGPKSVIQHPHVVYGYFDPCHGKLQHILRRWVCPGGNPGGSAAGHGRAAGGPASSPPGRNTRHRTSRSHPGGRAG
eukprot:gene22648-biopygen7220